MRAISFQLRYFVSLLYLARYTEKLERFSFSLCYGILISCAPSQCYFIDSVKAVCFDDLINAVQFRQHGCCLDHALFFIFVWDFCGDFFYAVPFR